MADENAQSLVEALLLGTLTTDKVQELQQRLAAGDPIVVEAYQETRRLLLALPATVPQMAPPPELKQRILQAVAQEQQPGYREDGAAKPPATVRAMPQRTFVQSLQRSLAWAAVFMLFAVGLAYYYRSQEVLSLRQERAELLQQLQTRQQEIEGLKLNLAFHLEMTKALQKPKSLLVDLAPTKPGAATGKVIVDRDKTRAYFVTADLPALEANKDYQLWYLDKSGRPVDGGVFQVDHSGYGEISVRNLPQNLSDITAFAVTIEPKGGSVNPTLDQMVLLGRV
ncbi:MAG: anti-sigma factor [bacterium]